LLPARRTRLWQAGQGLAVKNYNGAPECLANERLNLVKNPGYRLQKAEHLKIRHFFKV